MAYEIEITGRESIHFGPIERLTHGERLQH